MELTEELYQHLEAMYWDGYLIRHRELENEQADTFDELSSETTKECRRAGVRRIIDELDYRTAELETKVKSLKVELTCKNETLREKNLALDALCFVWCSGGCRKGVCRYSGKALTKQMVEAAEKNTRRMREWYANAENRKQRSRV